MPAALAAFLVAALLPFGHGTAEVLPPDLPVDPELPPITAAAWLLYDVETDSVLASHNADEERPMASVTKLMSAVVASRRADPDELVVISDHAAAVGEAEIGLVPGELWTVRDLLAAMMVRSGNDAAVAVAEHIAGNEPAFIRLMNEEAAAMGMANSSFANPHGLDAPDHYTTASDLLIVAQAALEDPLLTKLMRTQTVRFRPDSEGRPRRANSTNKLLGVYPGTIGMKTGFTGRAGKVLVSAATQGERTLIAVVMGSKDHFDDSRRLLEYGFNTHGPRDIMLAALVRQEGGGGTVATNEVAAELRARLASAPLLDNGRWAPSRPTPLEREIQAPAIDLFPRLGAGDE
jgi:D-alanyl-D-alanine carboxypeptidase